MDGLSVIIPSRNEAYLEHTIKNVLQNARGDIEILVALDGWLPDPPIHTNDPRVIFFDEKESIGQRQSINKLARIARGKYVMKLDAHCAVDEGFDVKLAADCEYDWTVIPRMYNLDIDTFKPKLHKLTDYMYMTVRDDGQFRAQYYTGEEYRRRHLSPAQIDETMCCMGPCFFMHKDRFWELDGCDEGHGSWGSQGIEVACKAWLSGGKLMVNKKTWFAHWFRGGGGPGFPYSLSGRQVERARKHAANLWLNDNWPKATRKFIWLVDRFSPPGYTKEIKKMTHELYKPRNAKSHMHGKVMSVDNLITNISHYWDVRRAYRAEKFGAVLQFFQDLNSGKTFNTTKELKAHPYYEYVKSGLSKNAGPKETYAIMRDSISLFESIKESGLKNPVEVWVSDGKYQISRGTRRLAVLHTLGIRNVAVRIYESEQFMHKLRPNPKFPEKSITAVAQRQFQRWGGKATDKYWIHNYTPHYDTHVSYLMDAPNAKVLEVGVQRGPSIALWEEAFPNAQIFGVDIDLSQVQRVKSGGRITLMEGSQTDPKFNKEVVAPKGPFDMIVDDASHIPEHQKAGFDLLWDSVKPGGWYVVEDMYYRNYFRNKGSNDNMMAKIYSLVDAMQEKCEINAIHSYYNIIFIQKRLPLG